MQKIIFTEPIYKDYIWGGIRLKEYFHRNIKIAKVAESWEISTNKDGESKIRNMDISLQKLFEDKKQRSKIFGTKTQNMDRFPLLIKFIDANSNLSVQVHPDDKYAKEIERDVGKTEMWYVIDCQEDAQIICGMNDNIKQSDVEKVINNGNIKENLKYVNIKPGDSIYIPSGTIHAILGNTLICEVQQNSNLTYRVYDWDRIGKDGKPRQLHQKKAIEVINVNNRPILKHKENKMVSTLVSSQYFNSVLLQIKDIYKDKSSEETFYAMNVIKGNGIIKTREKIYNIELGDSFIIPSDLGEYSIEGKIEILKSYV